MTMNKSRGFTLIEVLVAITLMATLSLIGWKGLDAVERTSDRIFSYADDTLRLIRVVGQIERDIRQHASLDILADVALDPAQKTPTARPAATALPPGIVAKEHELSLVRAAGAGAWQQVHWYLQDGALHRAVGPAGSALPLPQPAQDDIVLDHIEAFEVRAWLFGRGWTAPPLPAATAAGALEVVVVRGNAGGREPYRKVVLLP